MKYFIVLFSCSILICNAKQANTIIFLNGPSSVGKTTVAKEIQSKMKEPYLIIGLDSFLATVHPRFIGNSEEARCAFYFDKTVDENGRINGEFVFGPWGKKFNKGRIQAIKDMADAGNNLILDEALLAKEIFLGYLEALKGYTVLFVGLTCPLEILLAREAVRSDRSEGMTNASSKIVHSHSSYDLEIDTSKEMPCEAADKIIKALEWHTKEKSVFLKLAN